MKQVARISHEDSTQVRNSLQDWLTLLQFERPDLVYVLPCRYNRQLGRDYQTGPWVEMFPLFHECGEDKGLAPFIVHGNSDSNI